MSDGVHYKSTSHEIKRSLTHLDHYPPGVQLPPPRDFNGPIFLDSQGSQLSIALGHQGGKAFRGWFMTS